MKEIKKCAFRSCKKLKRVLLAKGSQLERVQLNCFRGSGVEEITLPRTLKEIGSETFEYCERLRKICVEDGCEASLSGACVPNSAKLVLLSSALVGGTNIQDLRQTKELVVPEGTEKIGSHWFCDCAVEKVEIPASIKEIGADAFYSCKNLEHVIFASGSMLNKIGAGSFYNTKIEKIVIPRGVTEILKGTFTMCTTLKSVAFEEGSRLRSIGENAFRGCSNLAEIILPEGL